MALTSCRIFRNRKAVFFTLIAILIVTMFVLYFRMQIDIPVKQRTVVAESRISTMNDFVDTFENVYAKRALYAMSHRALGAITKYITHKNAERTDGTKFFVQNISQAFSTAVNESRILDPEIGFGTLVPLDGMIIGRDADENPVYASINSAFQNLSDAARRELGMDLDVNVTNLYLEQDYDTGPWRVRAVMELKYRVNSSGIATWERELTKDNGNPVIVEFDVAGFIDPYIAAMTNGTLNRSINISTLTPRQIDDVDTLRFMIQAGNYTFENYSAPSFLFRFEGNTSPSYCCGIESFIKPSHAYGDGWDDAEEDIYGNSYLDFQFWRGRCYQEDFNMYGRLSPDLPPASTLWVIDGFYPNEGYFKLDSYHRFKIYPNAGRYYTISEYNNKHANEEGFEPIPLMPKCQPKYDGCDGCEET